MIKTKTSYKHFKRISILIIICLLSLLGLTGCFSEEIISRDATNNDISIDISQEISLNINYKMTPKVDINNLEITFRYYSKSNKLLSTKIKQIGNVSEGTEYTISVSLTEFSIISIFQISYVRMNVTGGTVTYLQ